MTREELIEIIYNDTTILSCGGNCDLPEEEANSSKCCRKCAERELDKFVQGVLKGEAREMAKKTEVNNYIFVIPANGREATGGTGEIGISKDFVSKADIEKAKTLYKCFKNYCNSKGCSDCEFDPYGQNNCFLQYLEGMKGIFNEG